MRKLWLHIGAQRTATTSLQSFMFRNAGPLNRSGYLYPFGVERHKGAIDALLARELAVDDFAADLQRRADSNAHPIHSVVMSEEGTCLRADLSVLTRLREHFDLRVVYTLRRQDRWLESWYFQNIKWQWNPVLSQITFAGFMARRAEFHWINYDRYVDHLERVFGPENIELIRFERAHMRGGPVGEFARRIGLDPDHFETLGFLPPRHENASYSPAMAEFMRRLPIGIGSDDIRAALTDACAAVDRKVLGHSGKSSELLLPPAQRQALMAEYDPGNQALARRWFGCDQLFDEPYPKPDTPLADMTLPADTDSLMDRFVAPLIAELAALGALKRPNSPEKP